MPITLYEVFDFFFSCLDKLVGCAIPGVGLCPDNLECCNEPVCPNQCIDNGK